MGGLAATAGLCATIGLAAAFGAAGFRAEVWRATLGAVAFEPVAFAAVFAVLFGIALLLFFEDLAAEAFAAVRVSFTDARARLLVAPRLAAAAFLVTLEALFLRVFCDTACARNFHAPVRCFSREPIGARYAADRVGFNEPHIAHFPRKSMIYAPCRAFGRHFWQRDRD